MFTDYKDNPYNKQQLYYNFNSQFGLRDLPIVFINYEKANLKKI